MIIVGILGYIFINSGFVRSKTGLKGSNLISEKLQDYSSDAFSFKYPSSWEIANVPSDETEKYQLSFQLIKDFCGEDSTAEYCKPESYCKAIMSFSVLPKPKDYVGLVTYKVDTRRCFKPGDCPESERQKFESLEKYNYISYYHTKDSPYPQITIMDDNSSNLYRIDSWTPMNTYYVGEGCSLNKDSQEITGTGKEIEEILSTFEFPTPTVKKEVLEEIYPTINTDDWKTITHNELGFEIKVPRDIFLHEVDGIAYYSLYIEDSQEELDDTIHCLENVPSCDKYNSKIYIRKVSHDYFDDREFDKGLINGRVAYYSTHKEDDFSFGDVVYIKINNLDYLEVKTVIRLGYLEAQNAVMSGDDEYYIEYYNKYGKVLKNIISTIKLI